MPKYRKKPTVVEASQWFAAYDHAMVHRFQRPDVSDTSQCRHCGRIMHTHGWIDTLEGGHIVCPGDWIITGIAGEHYPCKPDIFAETYEPVPNSATATAAAAADYYDIVTQQHNINVAGGAHGLV